MPENPIQAPSAPTPAPHSGASEHGLILLAVVVIFFASIAYLLIAYVPSLLSGLRGEATTSASPYRVEAPVPQPLLQAVRAGEYASAVSEVQSILDDPARSPDEKALAQLIAVGSEYRLTGAPEARVRDIAIMKQLVSDPALSRYTRINTLNTLANLYSMSGRDPEVLTEVFKDAPYNSFLITGDPDLSVRRVYEWSYSQLPTSFAAINIARWYSEQLIRNPDQTAELTAEYAAVAQEYLNKADETARIEAGQDQNFAGSTRDVIYQYWRTLIIGRLATQIGAPYDSQYRGAYQAFFDYVATVDNVYAQEYELYARLFFAQRLVRTGDDASAQGQLAILTTKLRDLENADVNPFVRFLRNERANRPDGANWQAVVNLFELSSEFKTVVEGLL
jgi:hypothetical protein